MTFASPGWFWLLIPWAGLVVYLLRRTTAGTGVPFLQLWPDDGVAVRRRRMGVPPVWVILMLAAILAAVIAAARPGPGGVNPEKSAVIVIDRGRSLADGGGYRRAVADAAAELRRMGVGGRVRIVAVPGPDREVPADQFQSVAELIPPTGLDTTADVRSAVNRAGRETSGPILVVTGSAVKSESKRVIGIGAGTPGGVAVTLLSVRAIPKPAAMVTVLNRSAATSAVLELSTGKDVISRPIRLGPAGTATTEFFDLPAPGPVVSARIVEAGDAVDGRRWVTRESTTAGLDVSATAEPAVQRIARVYGKQHPSDPGVRSVLVGSEIPADDGRPAVVIAPGGPGGSGPVRIDDPALTVDVTAWPAAGAAAVPAGFRAVVMENEMPVVAVGTGPARRVWINLDLAGWSASPQFVIFFGNVFDYVTGGATTYGSMGPTRLGPGWKMTAGSAPAGLEPGMWPGVYDSAVGRQTAVNADPASDAVINVSTEAGKATDSPGSVGWGGYLLLAAMIVVLGSLMRLTRRESRPATS